MTLVPFLIRLTDEEAQTLDVVLDCFLTELDECGIEPDEDTVSLVAKVGLARIAVGRFDEFTFLGDTEDRESGR